MSASTRIMFGMGRGSALSLMEMYMKEAGYLAINM